MALDARRLLAPVRFRLLWKPMRHETHIHETRTRHILWQSLVQTRVCKVVCRYLLTCTSIHFLFCPLCSSIPSQFSQFRHLLQRLSHTPLVDQ